MIHRDYIMRFIDQLIQVLSKILFNKDNQNYKAALEEIHVTYKSLLGFDPHLIHSLTDSEIIALLKIGERFEVEKCYAIANLLKIEAEILEEHDFSTAYPLFQKSLSLFIETVISGNDVELENCNDEIDCIYQKIESYIILPGLKYKLFQYYEHQGRFSKAEDILFELIEAGYPNIQAESEAFFKRLRTKSDEELILGNLPRNEVEEGLREILKRFS
jgi:hypothetical protein